MDDPGILERMRADWNERAGEDANYYVAFGRREQDDEEFFATAAELSQRIAVLLKAIAVHRVGDRPGRLEPRKRKRRPKPYPLLRVLRP